MSAHPLSFSYDTLSATLRKQPRRWLVTGGAGFIGSHLVEELLSLRQTVVVLDNFSSGTWRNLDEVRAATGTDAWSSLEVREGDIRDLETCVAACKGVDIVLHQAAIASVPASIEDPCTTHEVNVTGTLNLLCGARDAGAKRFVYASSSAVYGTDDCPTKQEDKVGYLLSPYAASKAICETYAQTFSQCYQLPTVGLRYFNVFGPRQDPAGPYAAVIPLWIEAALSEEPIFVNGDGGTTRDFVSVRNVVQANLQAAFAPEASVAGEAFNIGSGEQIDLNALIRHIADVLNEQFPDRSVPETVYRESRAGDIRHSLADVSKAQDNLGFQPRTRFKDGLAETLAWYAGQNLGTNA